MKLFKEGKMYRVKRKHWNDFNFGCRFWMGKPKDYLFTVDGVSVFGGAYSDEGKVLLCIANSCERKYCKRIRKAKKRHQS